MTSREMTRAEYLMSVIDELDRMRENAIPVEVAYLDRLVRFTEGSRAAKAVGVGENTQGRRRMPAWLRRLSRLLMAAVQAMAVLPALLRQSIELRRIERNGQRRNALVIAIASNRLPFSEGISSTRENLTRLGRALGDPVEQKISSSISNADYLLLFDPLPLSRYWIRWSACQAERVLIIDGAFLVAHSVFVALTRWSFTLNTLAHAWEYWRACRDGFGRRFSDALGCWLVSGAYSQLLQDFYELKGVFFTFNSFLTELLRADLITRRSCIDICEIMHGVGEPIGERYFATLLENGRHWGAFEKHRFIPQIPDLPLPGVYGSRVMGDRKLAINAYLNRYFIDQLSRGRTLEGLVDQECARICNGRTFDRPPFIITMFGNFSSWDKIETAAFTAELMLIRCINECRRRLAMDSIFVYVPHPLQRPSFVTPELLDSPDIIVYPKSIFCWLVSDACVSLVSSAMFEGAYFGARVFTPLVNSDRIFTDEYMNLLSHPNGTSFEDFRQELEDFLLSASVADRLGLEARASARLTLIFGSGREAITARALEMAAVT